MYDFANQPFTTLIVTFIFGKFFVEVLAKNEIVGTSLWSLGIAITAIFEHQVILNASTSDHSGSGCSLTGRISSSTHTICIFYIAFV